MMTPVSPLTKRQLVVARLAAKGHGYREIGNALGISHWTVRTHIIAIANRLPGEKNPLRRVRDWMQEQLSIGAT